MAASRSSTATPMWSILPNKGASLCSRRNFVPVGSRLLDAKNLLQRRQADLQLRRRRLLGRPVALDFAPGGMEGLGQRLTVVAVAPGEHLDRQRGAADADRGPRQL